LFHCLDRWQSHVTDGPFAEAKQVVGGYWIILVRSREEAIEWARRAPMSNHEVIEVRQIFEMVDFPADVQKAAEGFNTFQTPHPPKPPHPPNHE
jgi:hypothetical protein